MTTSGLIVRPNSIHTIVYVYCQPRSQPFCLFQPAHLHARIQAHAARYLRSRLMLCNIWLKCDAKLVYNGKDSQSGDDFKIECKNHCLAGQLDLGMDAAWWRTNNNLKSCSVFVEFSCGVGFNVLSSTPTWPSSSLQSTWHHVVWVASLNQPMTSCGQDRHQHPSLQAYASKHHARHEWRTGGTHNSNSESMRNISSQFAALDYARGVSTSHFSSWCDNLKCWWYLFLTSFSWLVSFSWILSLIDWKHTTKRNGAGKFLSTACR